ncbi:MAG TPA: universal stress protein [Caldimonas sp.]|nr:universal stress protein [Caldimonas sp.]
MYLRILVPIDGSATSERGLTEAIAIARMSGGSIRLLHVLDELVFLTGFETGATYLKTVLPQLREQSERILVAARERVAAAGIPVDTVCAECFARRTSDIIVEQATAWPADLIVLGTHGRRGVGRLMLGSDAEQVLRMAPVPVLLVRSADDAAAGSAARPPSAAAATGSSAMAG